MSIAFLDPRTKKELGTTTLAKRVLLAASQGLPEITSRIQDVSNWRKEYLEVFGDLAISEGVSISNLTGIATQGLAELASCVFTQNGQGLYDSVDQAWLSAKDSVTTISIKGTGTAEKVAIEGQTGPLSQTAKKWVSEQLAEPGLVGVYEFLDTHPDLPIRKDLLIALAGAAEFAPTEHWLRWGGQIAVIARSRPETWLKFIRLARLSSGELLIPILQSKLNQPIDTLSDEEIATLAGLDLVENHNEVAGWISDISTRTSGRLVLGCYAYAPSTNHIRVQSVQDALIATAMKNVKPEKLGLSWLATPTDSAPGPREIANAQVERYSSRGIGTIIRDSFFGAFGQARPARPKNFLDTMGAELTLINSAVQQQGPSYSFSKRTQRWRAHLAHQAGVKVSYAVSPPARTNSVLSHKILKASYKGAPLFGIKPFEVATAKSAIAAVLLRDLHDKNAYLDKTSTVDLHTYAAIHGGLWRLAYNPKTVWTVATLLGLPALLQS
jgi:hypothetical protein